jgi:hypothetical protein
VAPVAPADSVAVVMEVLLRGSVADSSDLRLGELASHRPNPAIEVGAGTEDAVRYSA